MSCPSAGIGKIEQTAAPAAMQRSALHDRPDRADGGHNDRRPEFPDGAGQERLTGEAGGSAGFRIEPIYRIRACIDQVTARGLERCKKISIGMRRLHQWKASRIAR